MLGVDFSREQVMEKFPTARTFPIVVVDGFYIGGYNQLEMRLNEEFKDTRRLLNEDML